MLTFRTLADLDQAQLSPEHRKAVTRAVRTLLDAYGEDYDPEHYGYVVLVNRSTTDADAMKLMGRPWRDSRLEGVTFDTETNCFTAVWLANNQYCLTILVPHENWLDPAFLSLLREELGDAHAP